MRRPSPLKVALAHVAIVLITVITLYPVLWVVKMALTPSQAFASGLWPFPEQVSLQNFADVIGTTDQSGGWLFGRQLFNSLFIAIATSALGLALSTTAVTRHPPKRLTDPHDVPESTVR